MAKIDVSPAPTQGATPAPAGIFPEPAIPRRSLRLSPAERQARARLERIGRTPVLERSDADLAFEEGYQLGEALPGAVADAIEGLLAGVRAAERRSGREILMALRVETRGLQPRTAAAVRDALRRGVEG